MKILLKDILAVLPNGDGQKVENVNICIDGDTIVAMGGVPVDFKADKTINGDNRLAIAGLINCHTHSYMSLF
ncbi:MAG: N-ethylammeline chlorohydrolase, partial [Oscillospiraceae bacterium]